MVVCHCLAINDRSIRRLLADGDLTVDDVAARCGAGARCGGCVDTIHQVLERHQHERVTAVDLARAS